jgi:hypothetical protein
MEVPISENNDLENEFDEICRQNAEDADFYGQKYNNYNPELHLGCFVQGVRTLAELREALVMVDEHLEYLIDQGWELAFPVDEGMIMTKYVGEGMPPKEDSQFDEHGVDLEGNTIDDYQEWEDDSDSGD